VVVSVVVSICNATTNLAYMLTTPFTSKVIFAVAVGTLLSPTIFFSRALYKKGIVYKKCYIFPLWAIGCALYSTKLLFLKPINNWYYRWMSGTDDHYIEASVDTPTLEWAMTTSAVAACVHIYAQRTNYLSLVALAPSVYNSFITAMQVSVVCSCVLVGCVAVKTFAVCFPGLCPSQHSCVPNKGDDDASSQGDGDGDGCDDDNAGETERQAEGQRQRQVEMHESGVVVSGRDKDVSMDAVALAAGTAGTSTAGTSTGGAMGGVEAGEAGLLRKMIAKLERTVEKLDRKVNEQSQVIIEMLTHLPHEAV
jgi:hypothetical protein